MFWIYLTIFWLVGIWFADTATGQALPVWALGSAAFVGFAAAYLLRKIEPASHVALICLGAFCLGGLRMRLAKPALSAQHVVHLNETPRVVRLTGQVVGEPDVRDEFVNLRVRVDSARFESSSSSDGQTQAVEGVVLVSTGRYPVISYGTQLTLTGRLREPFESAEFSYKEFLAREGIYSTMMRPRVEISAENQGNPIYAALLAVKSRANATINTILPAPESAVLQSMLFGDRTFLPDALLDDYRTVGLAHTIVVSGFHVGIIMLIVLGVAQLLTSPRRALLITAGVLLLYALTVGLKPAVIRAIIMSLAFLIGQVWLGRRSSSLAILGSVAFMLTAINPFYLQSVSFQLSFAATLGIILYTTPFRNAIQRQLRESASEQFVKGGAGQFITILSMTLSAQLLTLPLVAWHFEQVSLISVFANIIVVPLQPLIMVLGGMATLVGLAIEPLGQLVGWIVWLPLRFTVIAIETLARVPYASVPVAISTFSLWFIYFIIGAVSWYQFQETEARLEIWERLAVNVPERALTGSLTVGCLLLFGWHNAQPDGMLHVTFFDVAQGDAVLIETPSGRQILVDAGLLPSAIKSHLGRAVPFWDRSLDMLIATHPDADHVAGIPEVLSRYQVDYLLVDGLHDDVSDVYLAMLDAAAAQGLAPQTVQAGQVIEIGDGVRLEIVHPGATLDDEVRNNNSIGLRLVYDDFSLLLTGDAEDSAENEILARGLPIQSLVYKAGHHGSNTSSTPAFLAAVDPQIVIVSAGENNRFGHPHPEVMARFDARGATVLCTAQFGSIEVITDGQTMWWEASKRPTDTCDHTE